MRAFIGIKLDDCISDIISLMENLKKQGVTGNFTNPNNIHLTIEFLGEIDNKGLDKIKKIFNNLMHKQFTLTATKLTNLRDILILEIDKNNELMNLQKLVHEELLKYEFSLENRKYYPHITLVRKSNININQSVSLSSKVKEVILFSSERINNELIYTPIIIKQLEVK